MNSIAKLALLVVTALLRPCTLAASPRPLEKMEGLHRPASVPRTPKTTLDILKELMASTPPPPPKPTEAELAPLVAVARQGNVKAQLSLARIHWSPTGVMGGPEDWAKARPWYEMASERGSGEADYALSFMHGFGYGVPKDGKRATELLARAARRGYAEAQFEWSRRVERGDGVAQNAMAAADWCRRAADQGCLGAQRDMIFRCQHGKGVAPSPKEAARWALIAGSNGSLEAVYTLGTFHQAGYGVKKDLALALEKYEEAARHCHPKANLLAGLIRYNAKGPLRDHEKAAHHFHRALLEGSGAAECMLGLMCLRGHAFPKDRERARKWFESGTQRRHGGCAHCLAQLFLQDGKTDEACRWAEQALGWGFQPARKLLDEARRKRSAEGGKAGDVKIGGDGK